MRAQQIMGMVATIAVLGCHAPLPEAPETDHREVVSLADAAPLSFVAPQEWDVTHDKLTTILKPAKSSLSSPSIVIQPMADGSSHPSSAIPLLERAFEAQPEIQRFVLQESHPSQLDGAPTYEYLAQFSYFDVPMYRHGHILALQDLLIDIAITSPLTQLGDSDLILESFVQTITLPASSSTIEPKGIGANSRL